MGDQNGSGRRGPTVAHVEEEVVPLLALVRPNPEREVEGALDGAVKYNRGRHKSGFKLQAPGSACKLNSICTHYQTGIHSGQRPNIRADVSTVMTPKKNETLSRVRRVRDDSQLCVRWTSRDETWAGCQSSDVESDGESLCPMLSTQAHLAPELAQLAVGKQPLLAFRPRLTGSFLRSCG